MRRILILVPLVLSAALLAGCTAGAGSMSDSGMRAPEAMQAYPMNGSPATGDFAVDSTPSKVMGPQIITTVELTVTVKTPLTSADAAADIAEKFAGSVSYRSESAATDYSNGSAQLTLRIPSAKLTQALDELKELGITRDTSINAVDVTTEVTDLDARITSLQTSVDRLLTLMAQATDTENLLAVESALSERQANLESLQAQKRNLDDQVALSTVNLYLVSDRDTPAPDPDNFWTGLIAGWTGFVAFWAGVLVALGVLVPWLIAAGLLTMIILAWVKLARRRRAATTSEVGTDAAPAKAGKA